MLRLNTLLREAYPNFVTDKTKIFLLRHEDKRVQSGLYQVWRSRRKDFEAYQNSQKWKNRFPVGSILAAFVLGPAHETLFVGTYDVLNLSRVNGEFVDPLLGKMGPEDRSLHETTHSDRMQEFEEKLIIEWGPAKLAWRQITSEKNNKVVLEIRSKVKDEPFPPYVNFLWRLGDLDSTYPSWQIRLEAQKGVYLLTFDDGMQYVGSATGAQGFWQRWSHYLATGHGGNRVLIRDQRDARKAMVSILEVSGSAQTDQDIVNQEMLWKRKLGKAKPLDSE